MQTYHDAIDANAESLHNWVDHLGWELDQPNLTPHRIRMVLDTIKERAAWIAEDLDKIDNSTN